MPYSVFLDHLSQELMNRFDGSAALEVRDPINFAAVIGRRLPGWRQGFEGFCDYEDGPIVRDIGHFSIDDLKEKEQDQDHPLTKWGKFAMGLADPAVFFRKRLKYQSQSEYRFVWIVDRDVPQPLIVECQRRGHFVSKGFCLTGSGLPIRRCGMNYAP